jgi:hypothetical protein
MSASLILSAGMPRAGSGWFYNLTYDLMIASGFQGARQIRKRYHLESILTEVNCNIGALTPHRLFLVLIPVLLENRFVIKTHAGPTPLATFLIQRGIMRTMYIYRDPRDALLSAFEYGQRARQDSRAGVFSQLLTIEDAIHFMEEYVKISKAWLSCDAALHTRYEDFLLDYENEVKRIARFLELDFDSEKIQNVIKDYSPESTVPGQRGMHLVRGKIGRYKTNLTPEQQSLCVSLFRPYLEEMDYAL